MIHRIHKQQGLTISIDEGWAFLSDPNNLSVITPDHMQFKILNGAESNMYPGQIIEYTVCPFPKVKMKWVTEITHVKDREYFVDEQRFGPYALWHHKHFLKPTRGGIIMEDLIHYKLPYGFLGNIIQPMVARQLKDIFNYRENKLKSLFGELKY
ncbi:hypothetical protein P278_08160 [Zhouia amylolytica AD3]|uniref:Cell division inhibitor n=2 Tax=Zhouia amylolytica TaxID=376730 RepID=W2UQ90_9FLAO|nr:hypothetical protein P278_08160 [Zhouia amylolytica AD3]